MRYREHHRPAATRQRLRRSSAIAALAASALLAPLVTSGPVASQAATTSTDDTLANHAEWRLSSADPSVAAQITRLKQTLNERGVTYDPADVAAYRVPTIDGWTTYVTAKPETMHVRPNPDLLERTPEGVAPLAPTTVALNFGADRASIDAIGDVQQIVGTYVISDLDLTATIQQVKDLVGPLDVSGVDETVAKVTVLLTKLRDDTYDQAMTALARIQAAVDRPLPDPNAVVQQIKDALGAFDLTGVDPAITAIEELIDKVRTFDPIAFVAQLKAMVDALPLPTVDPDQVIARVTKLVSDVTALDELGIFKADISPGAMLFEVIPFAVVAAPDMVDNVMVNPNLPDGAREEHDGSSAHWEVPPGAKDCFDVVTDAFRRLVCWRIEKQYEDNDPSYNFWQLHTDVSGESTNRYMERMWVEAVPQPEGGSNQRWDQMPMPSADFGGSEGCSTSGNQFSVASGAPIQVGFAYYWERTTCENYMPKSYSDQGHWASIWQGNPMIESGRRRAVMVKTPVKTPADKGVSWSLLTGQRTRR